MTFTLKEFRQFLDREAVYEMEVPEEGDSLLFDIPLPNPSLVVRVDSGINLHTQKNDGKGGVVMIYDVSADEQKYRKSFNVQNDWDSGFLYHIQETMSNWRRYL